MANKYTTRDLWEYNFNENNYNDLVTSKQNKLNAESAVANYGPFNYSRQQDYDNALNAKLNQGKFSYDLNADVLYQQYKDNYINQGKQAMVDTMGQAAAMTGGYGNSYAATVGNQTYQGYLSNLNNMIPQLQQMALDRYNAESNRLNENFNILGVDRQNALAEHESGYNKLVADRDYYGTDYSNTYKNTLDLYNNQFTANNDAYWNDYNANYTAEQDRIKNANDAAQLLAQQNAAKIAGLQAGATYDKDGNVTGIKPSNSISLDDIEVDENGNITGVNGYTLAGDAEKGVPYAANISGFNGNKNDNFTVTIGDKQYNLENEGEVDDDDLIKKLNKSGAKEKQIVTYNGNAYIMYSGKYYKMGNQETWFGLGNNGNYSNLLKALQK